MNANLYKQVHSLATSLLEAADNEETQSFTTLYDELKALCYENENSKTKNHPVQWETLGDFTEESDEAIVFYKKAIGYAEDIQANDYLASIKYAMALLFQDEGNDEEALAFAEQAKEAVSGIADADLHNEINSLLKTLE